MDIQYFTIALFVAVMVVLFWVLFEFIKMKAEIKDRMDINNEPLRLKLQAYERLAVFIERSSLKNIVNRIPTSGLNVIDYQLTLLETIRTEYEYNVSQQIYISPEMWKAIGNFKDQNIFIINQIAANLPTHSPGIELGKLLMEYASAKNADLSAVIAEALQFEAKKVL
ncbi:DUF7935 family protein [Ferruginibacter albus]|uniref:DUF7935 family protein n=1 Tax=Ferruginibacter albus TaxID=2875540 RepID=UPI001CC702D7|nr:hypothetical protein [Ferruginibacter albus]UAY50862.1 hypothetical protein K9M53_09695 [Ferruginibacter albus]